MPTLTMRVDPHRKLFVGVRIDGRMREQLEKCPQRDRIFFEPTDAGETRYLCVLRSGEETYIGKIVDAAREARALDDIRRNVWSILQRVCPGRRDEGEIKVLGLSDDEPAFAGQPLPGRRGAASTEPSRRGDLGFGSHAQDRDSGAAGSGDDGRDDYY